MTPFFVALGYAWISLGIAFVLIPWSIPLETRIRAIGFWAVAAPFVFLVPDPLYILIGVALLLVLVAPVEPVHRAAFFIIAAPAVPNTVAAPLPFPGIQQLLVASHYTFSVVFLLVPLLVLVRTQKNSSAPISALDLFPWFFLAYAAIILLITVELTMAMRATVDLALMLAVPFYFLRRVVSGSDDVKIVLQAVVVVAIILMCAALISAAKQWDFYKINVPATVFSIGEARFGYLRIHVTMGNNALAFHMIMGLIALEVLGRLREVGWLILNTMRLTMPVGIFMCDSRGALLATVLAYLIFIVSLMRRTFLRATIISAMGLGMLAIGIWLMIGDFTSMEADSFTYRQELLRASIEFIAMYPIFGYFNFLESGHFDHLVQGQGIVDIANLYLQILVQYGLVGMFLLFPPFFAPVFVLGCRSFFGAAAGARSIRNTSHVSVKLKMIGKGWTAQTAPQNGEQVDSDLLNRLTGAATLALLASWLFLSATTSDAGLMLQIGLVVAALGGSLVQAHEQKRRGVNSPQVAGRNGGAGRVIQN